MLDNEMIFSLIVKFFEFFHVDDFIQNSAVVSDVALQAANFIEVFQTFKMPFISCSFSIDELSHILMH